MLYYLCFASLSNLSTGNYFIYYFLYSLQILQAAPHRKFLPVVATGTLCMETPLNYSAAGWAWSSWPKWRDWTAAQLGFPLLKHNKLSEVSPGSIGKQANIAKENVTTLPRTENNKQQKSCCPQMQDTLGRKEFLILILICPDAVVQMDHPSEQLMLLEGKGPLPFLLLDTSALPGDPANPSRAAAASPSTEQPQVERERAPNRK